MQYIHSILKEINILYLQVCSWLFLAEKAQAMERDVFCCCCCCCYVVAVAVAAAAAAAAVAAGVTAYIRESFFSFQMQATYDVLYLVCNIPAFVVPALMADR